MIGLKKIRNRLDEKRKLNRSLNQSDNSASNESKDSNVKLLFEDNNANMSNEFAEVNQRYSSGIVVHERSITDQ